MGARTMIGVARARVGVLAAVCRGLLAAHPALLLAYFGGSNNLIAIPDEVQIDSNNVIHLQTVGPGRHRPSSRRAFPDISPSSVPARLKHRS